MGRAGDKLLEIFRRALEASTNERTEYHGLTYDLVVNTLYCYLGNQALECPEATNSQPQSIYAVLGVSSICTTIKVIVQKQNAVAVV